MGEYEDLNKKLHQQCRESAERFGTPGPGTGDEKLYTNNRDMRERKEQEARTLREMQACAPESERPKVDDALVRTEREAAEFGQRADHYAQKLNRRP